MGIEGKQNGERFSDLCVENNLIIGRKLFKHRIIHKTTRRFPDENTVREIDHIIINQKWRRSLQDVRASRGAGVGSDTPFQVVVHKKRLCAQRVERFV